MPNPNRRNLFNTLALLSGAALVAMSAQAQSQTLPCAPRERVLESIVDRMGAERLARGRAAQGASIELYATPSGDWTLILHLPDGRACLLGAGDQFEATQGLQPVRGEPT